MKQTKTQASDSKILTWCLSYEPSILRLQKTTTTTKNKQTKMKQTPQNSSFSEQFEFLLLPVTAMLTGQAEVTRGLWLIALCLSYFSCCFDEICDKEDLEGKSMVMAEDHVVCMAGKTDGLRGFSRKSRGVRQRVSKRRDEGSSGLSLLPSPSEPQPVQWCCPIQSSVLSQVSRQGPCRHTQKRVPRPFPVL